MMIPTNSIRIKQFCFFFLIASFILISCKKDELTLPSEVVFEFGMQSLVEEDESKILQSSQPSLIINSGELIIDAIEFDGRRNEGKDVYFISNFSEKLVAQLKNHSTNFSVKFDIPQGVYHRIDVIFHIESDQTPIVLEGELAFGVQNKIPVRFEYRFSDQILVKAKPKQGQEMVLRKDKLNIANVQLNAKTLFRFINPSVMANGNLVNLNGEDTLLINEHNNIDVFNQLASRINSSFEVVFE